MRTWYFRFATFVAALLALPAFAGSPLAYIVSDAPSSRILTPGQVFTVTLTARAPFEGRSNVLSTLSLNDPSGQFQIVGGTCAAGASLADAATCTVQVRFSGNQNGNFTGLLSGSCAATAAVGGYLINCGVGAAGPVATLAQFTGAGVAVAIAQAVDTLGAGSLGALVAMMLAISAFYTLRARR